MEKVFFVVVDDLEDVNAELESGGRIKTICPVSTNNGSITGDVFAYVVIEYPDNQ